MIILHAFANMFPGGVGETKDMRIQWALEEMGLPYRVRPLDYLGGEAESPEFAAISPFNQIPVLEHDGLALAESGVILIRLAEVSGRLMPADDTGRLEVIQWCFAASATVAPTLSMLSMFDAGLMGGDPATRDFLAGLARRWLGGLERRLANDGDPRDWIAGDFSIADIMMAHSVREIRAAGLIETFPHVSAWYARALARPAWRRTRELTAERMGVDISDIP